MIVTLKFSLALIGESGTHDKTIVPNAEGSTTTSKPIQGFVRNAKNTGKVTEWRKTEYQANGRPTFSTVIGQLITLMKSTLVNTHT
jgi:hypothetical protein